MDRQIQEMTFGPFIVHAAAYCSFFLQLYNGAGRTGEAPAYLYLLKEYSKLHFLTLEKILHRSSVENPRIAESYADTMRVVQYLLLLERDS